MSIEGIEGIRQLGVLATLYSLEEARPVVIRQQYEILTGKRLLRQDVQKTLKRLLDRGYAQILRSEVLSKGNHGNWHSREKVYSLTESGLDAVKSYGAFFDKVRTKPAENDPDRI